jgi:L,D-peptidoglycan transpeptidase YkuD (ErfK/YbiS/YcfS/YnhG family)
MTALTPSDGWCDAIEDENYNCFITHPYPTSAEHLWREDKAYDLIITLGHNDDPVKKNKGSAIFLHVARLNDDETGFHPTKGCIAVEGSVLLEILKLIGPESRIRIKVS